MAGRIFAVVGPSGAGKDTLISAAQAMRPDLAVARRVITRPEDAGGEQHEGVSEAEFAARAAAGAFALQWCANGHRYGIPAITREWLAAGRTVVFNGSRDALGTALAAFPGLRAIHVTAHPAVLAARLAARGREDAPTVARRLARATAPFPPRLPVVEVENAGDIARALRAFLAALQPESA